MLGVLGLDVRLLLLANANKCLGHLPHVHHAGGVLRRENENFTLVLLVNASKLNQL